MKLRYATAALLAAALSLPAFAESAATTGKAGASASVCATDSSGRQMSAAERRYCEQQQRSNRSNDANTPSSRIGAGISGAANANSNASGNEASGSAGANAGVNAGVAGSRTQSGVGVGAGVGVGGSAGR